MIANNLTKWEKRMKASIEIIIADELKNLILLEKVSGVREYQNNPVLWNMYYAAKKEEYEKRYRMNRTLGILRNMGMDIERFKTTWMYTCERGPLFLRVVQDTLDGFTYDEQGNRIKGPNVFDTEKANVVFDDEELQISNPKQTINFILGEQGIIGVNGKEVLNLEPLETDNKKMEKVIPEEQ